MLYAVHMDTNVWGDPTEFRPERFLDADGNIVNKDLVIPFSIGIFIKGDLAKTDAVIANWQNA